MDINSSASADIIAGVLVLVSVLVQFSAALYALRLVRITGVRLSWIFISCALFLMGIRRIFSVSALLTNSGGGIRMENEVIGLVLSVLMFLGVYLIRPLFIGIKDSEKRIQGLLLEKELLLKEVHHRIKNNMNVIHSLLSVQSKIQKDDTTKSVLSDAAGRVLSMKILYDRIYTAEGARELSLGKFFPDLIHEIVGTFPGGLDVRVDTDIGDIAVPENLLSPLGILLNELIANSMKHAFDGRDDGGITVTAEKNDDTVVLCIGDNGKGLPESVTLSESGGFGLYLVSMLVQQIDGTLDVARGNGTVYTISFKV